jgi:hypothetical protein
MLELTSEYNRDMAKANQEVALAMTSNNATGNIGALNEFNASAQIRRQHIVAVARRAVELIKATRPNVTDIEYSAIAKALVFLRDPNAVEMFDRAIRAAPSEMYKIFNYRDYAQALFASALVEGGRKTYQSTIKFIEELERALTRRRTLRRPRIDLFDRILCVS